MLNLRWPQVDLDEGTITLVETKAGRPQVIAVNAPARQVLQELMPAGNSEPTGWVLPRQRDPARPLSIYNLESVWQRIRAAAELEDVRLHDLRHTVGTYAGQSGANAFMVRDLLRHSGLAMTGRYVNRSADPVRALSNHVGERIAAGLAGSTGAEIVPLKRGTPRERLQET